MPGQIKPLQVHKAVIVFVESCYMPNIGSTSHELSSIFKTPQTWFYFPYFTDEVLNFRSTEVYKLTQCYMTKK